MTFYDNGIQYDQRQFKLLSQIKEGKVPSYDQTMYPAQLMGWLPPHPTIRAKGCALTSLAMILSYHGIKGSSGTLIKLDELNEKLKEVGGYTRHDQIEWWAVSAITGGKVKFSPNITFDNLERSICEYGPQMVGAGERRCTQFSLDGGDRFKCYLSGPALSSIFTQHAQHPRYQKDRVNLPGNWGHLINEAEALGGHGALKVKLYKGLPVFFSLLASANR